MFDDGDDDTLLQALAQLPFAEASAMLYRADESIAPYLPDSKRCYIFGSLGSAAAQFAIWLLPDVQVQ